MVHESCPLRMRSLALQIRTTKVPERSFFCSAARTFKYDFRARVAHDLNGTQEAGVGIPGLRSKFADGLLQVTFDFVVTVWTTSMKTVHIPLVLLCVSTKPLATHRALQRGSRMRIPFSMPTAASGGKVSVPVNKRLLEAAEHLGCVSHEI